MRRRDWSLSELDARWIDVEPPRHNVAFTMLCPFHGMQHRLTIRLLNPYDGGEPLEGPGIVVDMLANGGLDRLTLAPITGNYYDAIEYPGHGFFRIISGWLEAERMD